MKKALVILYICLLFSRPAYPEKKAALHVLPTSDHLLANSVDKLSFFKKCGEFVKEIKAPATGVPGALLLVLFNQTGQTDIWSAAWTPPPCWSRSLFRFFTTC